MTSDPPPAKVTLLKSAQASYVVSFMRGSPNVPYTFSGDGNASNGLGSFVDKSQSTAEVKKGFCNGFKSETDVDASSGNIERTITSSASVPSTTCTGGSMQCSVTTDSNVELFNNHAHPVNYHQVTGLVDSPTAGSLHFAYAWDSSDGDHSHLDKCQLGEIVYYDTSNGQTVSPGGTWQNGVSWTWYVPPPPFDQGHGNQNPTFKENPWKVATHNLQVDNHTPLALSDDPWPIGTFTVSATQFYAFHCDICMGSGVANQKNYEVLMGPIAITRTVTTTSASAGTYSITKSGLTASMAISR